MSTEERSCPGNSHYECSQSCSVNFSDCKSIEATRYLALVSITSSSISCIACVIILYSFWRWKDLRTRSRALIAYLSIADFFTAFGYIIGSVNYIVTYSDNINMKKCNAFTYACNIQSFITTWSSLSSFFWTTALAIYLYFSLVHSKIATVQKLIPTFHVLAWGFPILICLPLLAVDYLGYDYYAATTWCFIRVPDAGLERLQIFLIFISGKGWEIATYVIVIVLYILIKRHISVQSKKGLLSSSLNPGLLAILRKSDKRMIAIPVVFVLLRCWGTIHFFVSWSLHGHISSQGCTSQPISIFFTIMGILQAIGDGGQGWGNFILYVLAADKVRGKLVECICCRDKEQDRVSVMEERSATSSPQEGINDGGRKRYGAFTESSIQTEPTTS